MNYRLVAAAAIAVLGAILALRQILSLATTRPPPRPSAPAAPAALIPPGTLDIAGSNPTPESLKALDQRLGQELGRVGIGHHHQEVLHREAFDTIRLYLTGSVEDYLADLGARALVPPPTAANKEHLRYDWDYMLRSFRRGGFSSSAIVVRPRVRNGQTIEYQESRATDSAARPERSPSLPQDPPPDTYEVMIPGEVADFEREARFAGAISFWFSFNTKSGRWELTKLMIYDRPPEMTVVLPIL